ncbi:MAG: ABC transporter permease [Phycisphaera sp.]|nr:ABC transporter permease [Phycisphaera sp.]
MYQPLLANRYLTSRIIPLIAVAAVALCVALVIIVVSVMSGFLDMLLSSGRTLMADVIVRSGDPGLPYYDDLIDEIEALPESAGATPVVESFGLLKLPYEDRTEGVQVWGIEPTSFARVVDFEKTLAWNEVPENVRNYVEKNAAALDGRTPPDDLGTVPQLDPTGPDGVPRAVLGIEIETAAKNRTSLGTYEVQYPRYWMPLSHVELTLLPISRDGRVQKPDNRRFEIANEFSTGVYQIDSRRAVVGLETAQRMLNLEPGIIADQRILQETGEVVPIGVDPARVQMVLVRAADGVTPEELQFAVREAYDRFAAKVLADDSLVRKAPSPTFVGVRTWREQLRDITGPVEKERELMRILFSIVYFVCAGLVLSIFWAIVYEKTRDIGILRAVGASRPGILGIFLAYGLVIGLAGSVVGALLGWVVTDNINHIHEALGQAAPSWTWMVSWLLAGLLALFAIINAVRGGMLRTLLSIVGVVVFVSLGIALFMHEGFLMWDPRVYYFNRIPSRVDWFSAVLTMAGAIVFSVIGAAIPAARAADTDPVRALRYE